MSGVARAMNGNAMQRYGIEEQGRSKDWQSLARQEQRIDKRRESDEGECNVKAAN